LHIRGREATAELAQQLRLDAAKHVLDVGSGLGGAARYLASAFGCRVTGLDLTEEYCRTAQALTDRLGLSSNVVYRHGSALEMPF
jgi:cyclopropane fatty-acyl-phospholipid synthase-like methyltransferase